MKNALRECLANMVRAQARWELDASRTILGRRKKVLLIAAAPVVLMIALETASAADLLPARIPTLGGSKAYMPSTGSTMVFFGSILGGLVAGLITGVIGAGGGYILTPALMSFGVRGIMAVGTDQFHLFAKAIMGTTIHRRLGNVNVPLAMTFILGSVAGVTAGGTVSRLVFRHSPALSDALISTVYVIVLGALGFYAIGEWRRTRAAASGGRDAEVTTACARRLQAMPMRPRIHFDHDIVPGGRSVSVYPVIVCGLVVGFVASIMGVGGGFLTFPMFVYGLGVSTFTTVGTDILQIVFTAGYSSITQYALYGFVFYTVCVGMLLGSLVGVQIGAIATQMVKGSQIRVFYALTILAGFSNRLTALPRKLADLGYLSMPSGSAVAIENVGKWVFFAIVGLFSVWILAVFLRHVGARRAGAIPNAGVGRPSNLIETTPSPPMRRRCIVRPRKFAMGLAGLVCFIGVLFFLLQRRANGQTPMEWADAFFNRLAKHSANSIAQGRDRSAAFDQEEINFGIDLRNKPADRGQLARLIVSSGFQADLLPDGRVRVIGRLGPLARAALADADLAFNNAEDQLQGPHGASVLECAYGWWCVFDGLTRRFVQEGRGAEADFAKFMTTRVLEPAHNFRGIPSARARDHPWLIAGLLVFYVVYTLWYGFSILYLFEGLGITASKSAERKEA